MIRKNHLIKIKPIFHFILCCSFFMLSCGENNKQVANNTSTHNDEGYELKTETENTSLEIIEDSIHPIKEYPQILKHDINNISLLLSGQKPQRKSNLFPLTKDSLFIRYSYSVGSKYKRYNEKQLQKIYQWSEKELEKIHSDSKTIFYPFSGPDIIHACTVFPNGEKFYLFGLEPVGEIPDLENFKADSLSNLLQALNKSINDNLNLSFFLTKKMTTQLNNAYIKGTIPILLFFLSKMNYHVQDIAAVQIDDEGNLITETNHKNKFNKGVEITFLDTTNKVQKKMYYFSMDISDYGFKKYSGLLPFLENLDADMTTFVKSGSYCLHYEKYENIRNFVLNHSQYLVQDDTGIPYKTLKEGKWDLVLYGAYDKPVKIFSDRLQEDLKEDISTKGKPLDFRFGYVQESSIIYGIKI